MALGADAAAAGLWSRHAAGRERSPEAEHDPRGFARRVVEVAARRGPLVVYPSHEASIDALLDAWPLSPAVVLPYAGTESLRVVRDKRTLAERATAVGLGAPAVLAEGTARELRAAPLPERCVVKPVGAPGPLSSARIVRSATERRDLLDALPDDVELLVQEVLAGPLVGLALVLGRDGAVVTRFQQVARRTWPPDAGGSSLAVGVTPDAGLVARAAALLRQAGFWGLAQMQFLRGVGGPVLIDVNPRFWGSLPHAEASGAHVARSWHAVAVGDDPRPVPEYRAGVTYRRLEAELMAAAKGDRRLLLQRAPRPRVGAVWDARDPVPSALLTAQAIAAHAGRRLPGARGRDPASRSGGAAGA